MSRNEITPRQLKLWLILAATAALLHAGGGGYLATALAAGAILPLCLLFGDGFCRMGKFASFLEWIWAVLILARLLPASGAYWPGQGAELVVPLVLLTMAALTGGKERSARVGSSLFWLAGLMMAAVGLAAVGNLETKWMAPEPGEWSAGLIVTLLLPALTSALLPEGEGKTGTVLWVGVIAVAAAAILQGTLSVSVALAAEAPLYELGRGLGNGGFEILVSVAATLGWYGFASFLFEVAAVFAEQWGTETRTGRILTWTAASALIAFGVTPDGRIATGGSLAMWILLPMLHPKNKLKKDEKRC